MSFPTAVAGPSRLPYLARPVVNAVARTPARGYAAQAAEPEPATTDDKGNAVSSSLPHVPPGELPGFARWLRTEGAKWKEQPKGQKARWLGGNVVS